MIRIIFIAMVAALASTFAYGQSAPANPAMTYGMVPTVGQWNNWFQQKQDKLGFTPLNQAGGTMTGPLKTISSTTSAAGFGILQGVAPNVPNNGDLWLTSAGLYYRANSTTFGPIGAGTITGPGSTVVGNVATWNNTSGTALADGGKSLPAGAIVGTSDTQTLTGKTYNTAGSGNVFQINGTGITAVTGSGSVALATSPTLVTPVLGAATGTSLNLSGLTASSAVATDASKNLVSVPNTGSGNNVLATSPTLVTPALGIPSAVDLTNATNLPLATGATGTLALLNGGTGATTAPNARTNLGLTSAATATATVGGAWTPVLKFGGASVGITYTTQTGTYQRIGPLIYVSFSIVLTSKGSSTGVASIAGLPFLSSSAGSFTAEASTNFVTSSPSFGFLASGAAEFSMGFPGATGMSALSDTNFSNTTTLTMAGIYTNGAF